jgi:hypothetical protein
MTIPWNIYWDLPFVLALIGLVYSASRSDRFSRIWREAIHWSLQMAGTMALAGVVLYVGGLIL